IVVTELPHGVSCRQVMEEIEALANPKPGFGKKEVTQEQKRLKQFILDQVESVRDESDRKSKLRLVIEPRSSRQSPEEMMAALLVHTSLESRYAVNLTWLGLDGLPETKGIVGVLGEWGEFRVATVRRRTQLRLDRVQERIEIVQGRLLAYAKIDDIIKLIRAAEDQPSAKEALRKKYKFTERPVVEEPRTVILSRKGWIRARTGHNMDLTSVTFKEGDALAQSLECKTTDAVFVLAGSGKTFTIAAADIPSGRGDGAPVNTLVNSGSDAIVWMASGDRNRRLLMNSSAGLGFVCKLGG